MKRSSCRRLEELERRQAAAEQEIRDRAAAQSGAGKIREFMRAWKVDPLGGESQAEAFARALGFSTRELKDLLQSRVHETDS